MELIAGMALQPHRQWLQIAGPAIAILCCHRDGVERRLQRCTETGDEGGVAPSRLKVAPPCDGSPSFEDLRIGRLQRKEGSIQSEPEQAAGIAVVIAGRRWQGVDEVRIAL